VDTNSLIALRERMVADRSRLDILVNAAGFTKPIPHADLDALDDELIDRMFFPCIRQRGLRAQASSMSICRRS
jgi:NAD(P)-dependent dehydrogenase (short-subunit alcohol dehydrogenase family)